MQIDWYFENGTKVGTSDRNIREGHFNNGTTSLQIASNRQLSLCDSGRYTCIANKTGKVEQKVFTLTINSKYLCVYIICSICVSIYSNNTMSIIVIILCICVSIYSNNTMYLCVYI